MIAHYYDKFYTPSPAEMILLNHPHFYRLVLKCIGESVGKISNYMIIIVIITLLVSI